MSSPAFAGDSHIHKVEIKSWRSITPANAGEDAGALSEESHYKNWCFRGSSL